MPRQPIVFSLDGSPCTIEATGRHVLERDLGPAAVVDALVWKEPAG